MPTQARRNGPEHRALKEALAKLDGNQSELARRITERLVQRKARKRKKVTQSTVSWWLHHSFCVPPDLALDVEAITGVPAYRLQPDVFQG